MGTISPETLFRHTRAFEGAPVYRNVFLPPAEAAFDDLLGPEEDQQAAAAALRNANRVRRGVYPLFPVSPASHEAMAILGVFQKTAFLPTRYGDGSFPVWYGSMAPETTIYETAYHMLADELDKAPSAGVVTWLRRIYRVECTAILIDLTRRKSLLSRLTEKQNHTLTQRIGKRVQAERHPGLLAPSARHPEGTNLAIFSPRVLSNPGVVNEKLKYSLDTQTKQLLVSDANNRTIMSIDGNMMV